MSNQYFARSRLSDTDVRIILESFMSDVEVRHVADKLNTSVATVNRHVKAIRERIFCRYEELSPFPTTEITLNSAYFDRSNRGASTCIGLVIREQKVFGQIVSNCSYAELLRAVNERIDAMTTLPREGILTYDCVAAETFSEHKEIHRQNSQEKDKTENTSKMRIQLANEFCEFAGSRLKRMRGIPRENWRYHIRECEFRFNNRFENIFAIIEQDLRENSAKLSSSRNN